MKREREKVNLSFVLNLAFKTDQSEENVQFWWSVDDMWTFDNIGFR